MPVALIFLVSKLISVPQDYSDWHVLGAQLRQAYRPVCEECVLACDPSAQGQDLPQPSWLASLPRPHSWLAAVVSE